jgi:hypothetical protein
MVVSVNICLEIWPNYCVSQRDILYCCLLLHSFFLFIFSSASSSVFIVIYTFCVFLPSSFLSLFFACFLSTLLSSFLALFILYSFLPFPFFQLSFLLCLLPISSLPFSYGLNEAPGTCGFPVLPGRSPQRQWLPSCKYSHAYLAL